LFIICNNFLTLTISVWDLYLQKFIQTKWNNSAGGIFYSSSL